MTLAGYSARAEPLPGKTPEDFPRLSLPTRARGEAAVRALGTRLPALAAFYRTTEEDLAARLRRDKSLWVDEEGRLLYVCDWESEAQAEPGGRPAAAPYPEANTFMLHSRPGANRIIYLDFDGCDASGTSWGADAIGRAFDTDGNPFSFSSAERTLIQGVWQRVSEDYAMYDVDVTTEDPGLEALRKSNASDTIYGVRVAICGSSSDWYGKSAGGVAYVGSFNWNSDTPCWVFPGSLSSSEKNIAEAASHEAGHTLGLSHDGKLVGTTRTEYYAGQGDWAPIMGVGYSKQITQWSKGEYANANNTEDDLTKMLNYGVAYRTDDFGNSSSTAALLPGIAFNLLGNIERAADVDCFKFQTGAGRVTFTVRPAPNSPNLHILLSLVNGSGTVIVTSNPPDTSAGTQPASISTTLAAGVYYLTVQGVGVGDPLSTGYSDYASLGQYTLTGALPSGSGWIAVAPGTDYSWTTAANWASNTIPFGAGAVGRLANNIAGAQVIRLDTPQVLGGLQIGDSDSMQPFTLWDGTAGSLTFSSPAGEGWINKSSGANDIISASLILESSLVVTNNSTSALVFDGSISGSGSLRKAGSGTLSISGTNVHTGSTVVSKGRLILAASASLAMTPVMDVRSGAELDGQPLGGTWALDAGQSLTGEGTVFGDLIFENGAILSPGTNFVPGTLTHVGALTLQDGSGLLLDLGPSNVTSPGSNDLIAVVGDLHLVGTVHVDFAFPEGLPASSDPYTVITYTGLLTGSAANLQALNHTNRYAFLFDDSSPGEIRVFVSGKPADIVWMGTSTTWDVAGEPNWSLDGFSSPFSQFDTVTFDDLGLNTGVILSGFVEPGSVTVNASKDYTLSGNGKITGRTSILKTGSGILSVATVNDYLGDTLIQQGTVKAGATAPFGATNSGTVVGAGASLDLNGFSLGAERVTVSDAGNGNGALINQGSTQTNGLRFLKLSGDTSVGGTSRWDLRANPTAELTGNNFSLTKTGANEIWLVDAGSSGLGNIVVSQGTLGIQGTTTLGNSARSVTVLTNATLAFSQTADNALGKTLVLSGGRINGMSGFNKFTGPITLIGSNSAIAGSSLVLNGVISGAGSLNKQGSGTLLLTGANTYTGETFISGGSLETYNSAALGSPAAGTRIGTGGRLDVRGNNLGAEPITVQGTGLGNAGAIVNTGSSQNNALRFVTLSGATTFGGIGRWDIRGGTLTGNNFALSKRGPNEIWLVDLGSTGLGAITVHEGVLGIQGSTTLGSSASALTVNSTATVTLYGTGTNVLSKPLSLSSGRVYNVNGLNTFNGAVSLSGSNRFEAASGTRLLMTGTVSGSGAIYSIGSGTLVLTGNNTYSGLTRIEAGTLQFGEGGASGTPGSAGAISNSGALVFLRNNAVQVNNSISGTGSLRLGIADALNTNTGGTLILNGTNTYSGSTTVFGNGNMLAVANDACLGTGTVILSGNNNGNSVTGIRSANANLRTIRNDVQLGGGNRFQFGSIGTGDLVFNGARMISDNSDKTLNVSNSLTTINSAIGGNGRLIKTGPGTLALAGINTNGGTVIEMGTVRVDSEIRLGRNPSAFNSAHLTLNRGTLQTTASFAIDDSNRGVALMEGGGTFLVNPGTTLSLSRPISGVGHLRKTGDGTLQLNATNTYSGGTTNVMGSLVIHGEVRGDGVEVAAGTLGGMGDVLAPVIVQPAGTLSPGMSMIGALTISNSLQLYGTTLMEVDGDVHASDLVRGMSLVTFGGTLVVTNLQGTLNAGEVFELFDSEAYQGSFQHLILPPLDAGLFWDTTELTDAGTLRVALSQPLFASPELESGTVVLKGSGGEPGSQFVVRMSTNAALPKLEWPIILTNTFDAFGGFSVTNAIDPLVPIGFYMIQSSGW